MQLNIIHSILLGVNITFKQGILEQISEISFIRLGREADQVPQVVII
jgi:hypothetical protein